MGKEAIGTVRWNGQVSEGKILLEMPHLIFRGDFRLKIPVEGIKVEANRGILKVPQSDGTIEFTLGDQAEKWAEAILHPKGRLEKMGLKAGMSVCIAGKAPADFVAELPAAGVKTASRGADHSILFAETRAGLQQLAALEPPVWIVYPKGAEAISQSDVLDSGRRAGLKDVKVCSFSPTHTGLRFTLPAARAARR